MPRREGRKLYRKLAGDQPLVVATTGKRGGKPFRIAVDGRKEMMNSASRKMNPATHQSTTNSSLRNQGM